MGLLDKINKWRGFYDEGTEPQQEFASFPISFKSFEEFADPFARSMSMEIFRAKTEGKEIEDGVPYVLWGDRPASNEYVYIYRTDLMTEEKLESFNAGFETFVSSLDREYKIVIITLVCVEESSEAFEKYCSMEVADKLRSFEKSGKLIQCAYEMDEGSFLHLEEKLRALREAKTQ